MKIYYAFAMLSLWASSFSLLAEETWSRNHLEREVIGIRLALPWAFETHDAATIIDNCRSAHINTIMATIHATSVDDIRLKDLIERAHGAGLRFEAVISTFNANGFDVPGDKPNPDYHAVDIRGKLNERWLDPCKPAVREMVLYAVRKLCQLEIDGLQLDYMRFGNPEMGYSGQAQRSWHKWHEENPNMPWETWRSQVINDYLTMARNIVRETRPGIVFSASTWSVGPGWPRKTLLTEWGEGIGWAQGQDYDSMVDKVDYIRPMLYSCMFQKSPDWTGKLSRLAVENADDRTDVVIGAALAVGNRSARDGTWLDQSELRRTIQLVRDSGAKGIVFYHYMHMFDPKVAPDYEEFEYAKVLRELFPAVKPAVSPPLPSSQSSTPQ